MPQSAWVLSCQESGQSIAVRLTSPLGARAAGRICTSEAQPATAICALPQPMGALLERQFQTTSSIPNFLLSEEWMLAANGVDAGAGFLHGGKSGPGFAVALSGMKQRPATKLDPLVHGISSQSKGWAHSSCTGPLHLAPEQSHTKDASSTSLPWPATPDLAWLQPLRQAGQLIHSMVGKDRFEELQELSKDLVINSTTVDQSLVIPTIMHAPEKAG